MRGLASVIGRTSLGIGLAPTPAPPRSAAFLGTGDLRGSARVTGAAGLVVGAGLLPGRRRSRWILARALLNAVLAARVVGSSRWSA